MINFSHLSWTANSGFLFPCALPIKQKIKLKGQRSIIDFTATMQSYEMLKPASKQKTLER